MERGPVCFRVATAFAPASVRCTRPPFILAVYEDASAPAAAGGDHQGREGQRPEPKRPTIHRLKLPACSRPACLSVRREGTRPRAVRHNHPPVTVTWFTSVTVFIL